MIRFIRRNIHFIFFAVLSLVAIDGFSQNGLINPVNYFSSKSTSVQEKSYYVNVSESKAIQYFKSIGLIRYSANEYDPSTIRFRNAARNVFVMVFRINANRVYIVMSRTQYVDEVDV